MNTSQQHQHTSPPDRHESDSQGITLGNLLTDSARLGPAPSRTREAAVIVTTLVLFGIVAALIQPGAVIVSIVAAITAVSFVARWVIGTRKWDRR